MLRADQRNQTNEPVQETTFPFSQADEYPQLEAVSMGRPVEGNGDPLACAGALEYYAVSPSVKYSHE